jgi:hypothetical protein
VKIFFLIAAIILSTNSCRLPDSAGFYQPITLRLSVPDGPPEYKAGWHAGCKSALATKGFANAFVYQEGKGPDFGNGIYQHDPVFQTAWGQGWFSCALHVAQFVGTSNRFRSFAHGPLQ